MVFRLLVSRSSRCVSSIRFRYVFSWAKLKLALYMIWVFRAPSLAMSRISAIMNKRSLRLRGLSQFITLYTFSRNLVYLPQC